MNRRRRPLLAALTILAGGTVTAFAVSSSARNKIQDADQALAGLYATQPTGRDLAKRTKAILESPRIIKFGLRAPLPA